jgi:hypothetical protein
MSGSSTGKGWWSETCDRSDRLKRGVIGKDVPASA